MDTHTKPKGKPKQPEKTKTKLNIRWIVTVFIVSISISAILSLICNELIGHMAILMQFIVLLLIIFLGILFDIIGLAVATADEKQFHSMAARKIKEGKIAVAMIRNADKMSSVCNDVVGDICGIVSGATAASIAMRVFTDPSISFFGNLLVTALVSGMTIGGKAIGKYFGMNFSEDIIYVIAKLVRFIPMKTGKK
ncbi:MAG: hypothetical protein E7604_00325 [Ruminococcaceae bacterium]|nr:hypothetical protein [Oscillospiraceae bacterium]